MHQRIGIFLQQLAQVLVLQGYRIAGPGVAMIPHDGVASCRDNHIRIDDDRVVALVVSGQPSRTVGLGAFEFAFGRSPDLQLCLDAKLLLSLGLDADYGPICIDPYAKRSLPPAFSGYDLDLAFAQSQRLAKVPAVLENPRCKPDSHQAKLEQSGVLAPGIGLADIKDKVSTLLDPEVQAETTVADRH